MQVITKDQIEQLDCSISDIADSLQQAFSAAFSGDMKWQPKNMIGGDDGAFLMSTFCSWPTKNLNIFHSLIGATYPAQDLGAAAYQSVQLLTRYDDAQPLAIIDGTYTSRILPAGITRLMAGRLARSHSRVATFVGAGTQARVNLEALDGILPIDEVRIVTRTRASAERFASYVEGRGKKALIMEAGREALADADIIVTTVSTSRELQPFLDPAWVTPGSFVNAVDLGRSWKPGFEKFDYTVIDDRAQAEMQAKDGRMPHVGPYDSEIAEVVTGNAPERTSADQRIALVHPGNVVGVMGVSALIYSRLSAQAAQEGTRQ